MPVVEPLCKGSNPVFPHHLQKKRRKGVSFVNGGVVNFNGIKHTKSQTFYPKITRNLQGNLGTFL